MEKLGQTYQNGKPKTNLSGASLYQLDEILGGLKGIATSEDGSVDVGLKKAANAMYSKIMKSIIEALGEPTELISSIDSTKAKLAEQVKITQNKNNTPEVIEQAEAKRKEFLSILAQQEEELRVIQELRAQAIDKIVKPDNVYATEEGQTVKKLEDGGYYDRPHDSYDKNKSLNNIIEGASLRSKDDGRFLFEGGEVIRNAVGEATTGFQKHEQGVERDNIPSESHENQHSEKSTIDEDTHRIIKAIDEALAKKPQDEALLQMLKQLTTARGNAKKANLDSFDFEGKVYTLDEASEIIRAGIDQAIADKALKKDLFVNHEETMSRNNPDVFNEGIVSDTSREIYLNGTNSVDNTVSLNAPRFQDSQTEKIDYMEAQDAQTEEEAITNQIRAVEGIIENTEDDITSMFNVITAFTKHIAEQVKNGEITSEKAKSDLLRFIDMFDEAIGATDFWGEESDKVKKLKSSIGEHQQELTQQKKIIRSKKTSEEDREAAKIRRDELQETLKQERAELKSLDVEQGVSQTRNALSNLVNNIRTVAETNEDLDKVLDTLQDEDYREKTIEATTTVKGKKGEAVSLIRALDQSDFDAQRVLAYETFAKYIQGQKAPAELPEETMAIAGSSHDEQVRKAINHLNEYGGDERSNLAALILGETKTENGKQVRIQGLAELAEDRSLLGLVENTQAKLWDKIGNLLEFAREIDLTMEQYAKELNKAARSDVFTVEELMEDWRKNNPNLAERYDASKIAREAWDTHEGKEALSARSSVKQMSKSDEALEAVFKTAEVSHYAQLERLKKDYENSKQTYLTYNIKHPENAYEEQGQEVVRSNLVARLKRNKRANPDRMSIQVGEFTQAQGVNTAEIPKDVLKGFNLIDWTKLIYQGGYLGKPFGGNSLEEYQKAAQSKLDEVKKEKERIQKALTSATEKEKADLELQLTKLSAQEQVIANRIEGLKYAASPKIPEEDDINIQTTSETGKVNEQQTGASTEKVSSAIAQNIQDNNRDAIFEEVYQELMLLAKEIAERGETVENWKLKLSDATLAKFKAIESTPDDENADVGRLWDIRESITQQFKNAPTAVDVENQENIPANNAPIFEEVEEIEEHSSDMQDAIHAEQEKEKVSKSLVEQLEEEKRAFEDLDKVLDEHIDKLKQAQQLEGQVANPSPNAPSYPPNNPNTPNQHYPSAPPTPPAPTQQAVSISPIDVDYDDIEHSYTAGNKKLLTLTQMWGLLSGKSSQAFNESFKDFRSRVSAHTGSEAITPEEAGVRTSFDFFRKVLQSTEFGNLQHLAQDLIAKTGAKNVEDLANYQVAGLGLKWANGNQATTGTALDYLTQSANETADLFGKMGIQADANELVQGLGNVITALSAANITLTKLSEIPMGVSLSGPRGNYSYGFTADQVGVADRLDVNGNPTKVPVAVDNKTGKIHGTEAFQLAGEMFGIIANSVNPKFAQEYEDAGLKDITGQDFEGYIANIKSGFTELIRYIGLSEEEFYDLVVRAHEIQQGMAEPLNETEIASIKAKQMQGGRFYSGDTNGNVDARAPWNRGLGTGAANAREALDIISNDTIPAQVPEDMKTALRQYTTEVNNQAKALIAVSDHLAKIKIYEEEINKLKGTQLPAEQKVLAKLEKEKELEQKKLQLAEQQYDTATKAKEATNVRLAIQRGEDKGFVHQVEQIDTNATIAVQEGIATSGAKAEAIGVVSKFKKEQADIKQADVYLKQYLQNLKQRATIEADIQRNRLKLQNSTGREAFEAQQVDAALNKQKELMMRQAPVYEDGALNGVKLTQEQINRLNEEKAKIEAKSEVTQARITRTYSSQVGILKTISNTFRNSFGQLVGMNVIANKLANSVSQVFTNAIANTKALNKNMVDLQIASGASYSDIKNMMLDFNELAKKVGKSTQEVAVAANDWLRAGYEGEDAAKLVESSMQLSVLGMIESSQATEYLISVMKGWKLEVSEVSSIVDKLSAVDMAAAISAGDLATAMQRSSVSAQIAGSTLDRYIGMLTVVAETTQKTPETVGESFKTLYARYGKIAAGKFEASQEELEAEGLTVEDMTNLNEIEQVLNAVGIQIRDSVDSFRNFDDVLDEVAENWKTYSDVQKSGIATAIAGEILPEHIVIYGY